MQLDRGSNHIVIAKVGKLILITLKQETEIIRLVQTEYNYRTLLLIILVICFNSSSLVKCCSNPFLNANDGWYLFC